LTGQHNYPLTIARWTDRAYDLTGKYPAVYGQDFGFQGGEDKDSTLARPALIEEAKRQWRGGAIPTLTWHTVRPLSDEPVTFKDDVQGRLSDYEFKEVLTPGSALNKRWCEQVDVIAGYLKQLRDAHVPVLFRPYHEMNGGWFWWGGRPGKQGSAALYRQLYDRFVNVHHLDNLVWAWNVNAPNGPGMAVADYYPGADVADMLTLDVYGEFKQGYYDDMISLAAGKPIALGEVGYVPSPEVLKSQPNWTYFMTWSEWIEEANTLDVVLAIYNAPNTASRNDPRVSDAMAKIRAATKETVPEPVTAGASTGAKALLASLYETAGKNVFSGQENNPASPAEASGKIVSATGKAPAIFGGDLAAATATLRQAVVDESERRHANHAIVSLAWRPARPTDGDAVDLEKSSRSALTEFEWNELLTPGTSIYQRWCDQVDEIAKSLKLLDHAGVAVLWRPYPQSNGKTFWWAARKGNRGSAALYRQLYDRLVNHHGLKNLVWVWSAVPPAPWPDKFGQYPDYFPGLLYVDALAVDVEDGNWGPRQQMEIGEIGAGKVIGLGITGRIPEIGGPLPTSRWSWFMVSASGADSPALVKLYGDPRVVSLPGGAAAGK
jgi:mannan endo-1,4-beta-mannosidase